jgi:lipopolysaccharide export LptBFGC system permease protein LptF
MRIIEEKMEGMDHYFDQKSSTEKWMITLIIAAIVGYVFYLYLYPYAASKYEGSLKTQKHLAKKLREENTYLMSITINGDRNYYVKKYDREIGRKKRAITKYKEKIALLNKNFEKLSEVLFNRKNWALFLDSITDRAHVNDVELLEVTNKYVKGKANFGHVLEMGIRCKGKFQSILAFVNDLEQNKLVTDVYDSNIRYDLNSSNIVADLNVSVWGVNR